MRLHSRLVKEGFWTDTELIKELPIEGRLFYLGLIQLADDSGCLENDPMAFKILLFPGDPDITENLLSDFCKKLVRMGKLTPYLSVNKECFYLKNFHKHQTLKNPTPPEVPLPPWVEWEPYKSNQRTGKYSVGNVSDFCKKSVSEVSEGDVLQSSSNLNRNRNRNISLKEIRPDSEEPVQVIENEIKNEQEVKFTIDSTPFLLAYHLRVKILERDPGTKVPAENLESLQNWAQDADRMLRIDNRDPTEAQELITWCQKDDFWSTNILSMATFRKQYDKLKRKYKATAGSIKANKIAKEGDEYVGLYG